MWRGTATRTDPTDRPGALGGGAGGAPARTRAHLGVLYAIQLTSGLPTHLYSYERGRVRVVCPIAERGLGDQVDIVTPYGFGGFALNGDWGQFPEDWGEFATRAGGCPGTWGSTPCCASRAGLRWRRSTCTTGSS